MNDKCHSFIMGASDERVCSALVTAAFAFSGTELVGLAAVQEETLPKLLLVAVKQVVWSISQCEYSYPRISHRF